MTVAEQEFLAQAAMSKLRGVRKVNYVRRSSTLTPSTLVEFPPKQALFVDRSESLVKENAEYDSWKPETYALAQPPPASALSAFAHRIGLANVLSNPDLVLQSCTHPSFYTHSPHAKDFPGKLLPPAKAEPGFRDMAHVRKDNAHLAILGNSLMGLFATEYVDAAYPYLPTRVFKAAVSAYVGTLSCATVAQEMGAAPLLRWARTPKTREREGLIHQEAIASIPRALVGLLYQRRSILSARQFVHSYFLTRRIDLVAMIKFRDPKKALLEMVKKADREWPQSRLLKETGRFSLSPVFVVGIFSGADQLGEGFGTSLKMAEYRAAEDALLRVYLTRTPDELLQLPTSTFLPGLGTVFRQPGSIVAVPALPTSPLTSTLDPKRITPPKGGNHLAIPKTRQVTLTEGPYTPPAVLAPAEVMYQSGGRAAIRHAS